MEQAFSKFAEDYVYELEVARAKKNGLTPPRKTNDSDNNGKVQCGYDIESADRHIEVKSFTKKKTYKDLTPRQTEVMREDPLYFVYIVEFEADNPDHPTVLPIPQIDILEGKSKEFIRLENIANQDKRKYWKTLL